MRKPQIGWLDSQEEGNMAEIIDLTSLLDRCKNKRSNERDITLDPGDLEALIYRLREAEAGVSEAGQQLELCQQECHTVRRAYLHEKSVKETESNLAHMLLKALEIADHDEGTGGGQMAKQWTGNRFPSRISSDAHEHLRLQ